MRNRVLSDMLQCEHINMCSQNEDRTGGMELLYFLNFYLKTHAKQGSQRYAAVRTSNMCAENQCEAGVLSNMLQSANIWRVRMKTARSHRYTRVLQITVPTMCCNANI